MATMKTRKGQDSCVCWGLNPGSAQQPPKPIKRLLSVKHGCDAAGAVLCDCPGNQPCDPARTTTCDAPGALRCDAPANANRDAAPADHCDASRGLCCDHREITHIVGIVEVASRWPYRHQRRWDPTPPPITVRPATSPPTAIRTCSTAAAIDAGLHRRLWRSPRSRFALLGPSQGCFPGWSQMALAGGSHCIDNITYFDDTDIMDKDSYFGGKNGSGTYQKIINHIPPHTVYIETHLGGGAILRLKKPADINIGIDIDAAVIEQWRTKPNEHTHYVCSDAVQWLRNYQFTGTEFVYCDPPYLWSTRKSRTRYNHEYTDQQHIELLELLISLPCNVMISGYPSSLYDDRLAHWHSFTFESQTRGGRPATEQVWMNYQTNGELHDYQYVGTNYRERERIKRKKERWQKRLSEMQPVEKQALLDALSESDNEPTTRALPNGNNDKLILSLFPGIDLLSKPFEQRGFTVVRGPDLLFGGDIRSFNVPANSFAGVIAGPPCQEFSALHRTEKTGYSQAMLDEYARVVMQTHPQWWLCENVAGVPDVKIPGYTWQRFELDLAWYTEYSRLRHIQFGSKNGALLDPPKIPKNNTIGSAVLATDDRSFEEIKYIQGLPEEYDLPHFTLQGKKRSIGNAVPLRLAEVLAELIDSQLYGSTETFVAQKLNTLHALCACGCGRKVFGRARYQSPACRKRAQRRRQANN